MIEWPPALFGTVTVTEPDGCDTATSTDAAPSTLYRTRTGPEKPLPDVLIVHDTGPEGTTVVHDPFPYGTGHDTTGAVGATLAILTSRRAIHDDPREPSNDLAATHTAEFAGNATGTLQLDVVPPLTYDVTHVVNLVPPVAADHTSNSPRTVFPSASAPTANCKFGVVDCAYHTPPDIIEINGVNADAVGAAGARSYVHTNRGFPEAASDELNFRCPANAVPSDVARNNTPPGADPVDHNSTNGLIPILTSPAAHPDPPFDIVERPYTVDRTAG